MKYNTIIWSISSILTNIFFLLIYCRNESILFAAIAIQIVILCGIGWSKLSDRILFVTAITYSVILMVIFGWYLKTKIYIDEFSFTILVYLILQLCFLYFSPKIEQNSIFGIRTYFTMSYKDVWNKTHHFLPFAELATIPPLCQLIIYSKGWLRLLIGTILIILPLIATLFYSNIIGVKYHKKYIKEEAKLLKKQKEAEEMGRTKFEE